MTPDPTKLASIVLMSGSHRPPTDGASHEFCSMEAYAWACGLPHSDMPSCLPKTIARLFQRINDWHGWASNEERTAWLVPQMMRLPEVGAPDAAMERRIAFAFADYAVRVCAAEALDATGLKAEADALRAREPIVDRRTAEAAVAAVAWVNGAAFDAARGAADAGCFLDADAFAAYTADAAYAAEGDNYLHHADTLIGLAIAAAAR